MSSLKQDSSSDYVHGMPRRPRTLEEPTATEPSQRWAKRYMNAASASRATGSVGRYVPSAYPVVIPLEPTM